jgi:hypothetical protein
VRGGVQWGAGVVVAAGYPETLLDDDKVEMQENLRELQWLVEADGANQEGEDFH